MIRNGPVGWTLRSCFASLLVVGAVGTPGCSDPFGNVAELDHAPELDENGNGVFGPPIKVKLLEPFQGHWNCDRAATFALWKSQGKSELIKSSEAYAKRLDEDFAKNHDPTLAELLREFPHADIAIIGNIIVGRGESAEEQDLFALHAHGSVVCGKAWFHDDRYDPGDMSKVWIRLEICGDELRIHSKMGPGLPGLLDPDLQGRPTVVDASKCETAKEKVGSQLWLSYVFRRPAQKGKTDAK